MPSETRAVQHSSGCQKLGVVQNEEVTPFSKNDSHVKEKVREQVIIGDVYFLHPCLQMGVNYHTVTYCVTYNYIHGYILYNSCYISCSSHNIATKTMQNRHLSERFCYYKYPSSFQQKSHMT